MKKKNKGFMLLETLIVSTFILGTLVFLYVQFVNVKKSYDKSFRYNTVPNLYMTKNISDILTTSDYNKLDQELSNNAIKGYVSLDCNQMQNPVCSKLVQNSNIKYILYTSDDLSILKNYISTGANNDAIFDPEFKKYILQLQGGNISGRNRLIVYFNDTTFASIVLNSTTNNTNGTILTMAVGDYVSMTPTSTAYTISKNLTGYSSDQTINPSELDLWRVINVNDNGTVDMISEYVSSSNVYFSGQTGYLNYIGTLNTIAKQYENSNYTVGSRYIGYSNQTEKITDTSKFTYPAPWTSNTSNNNNEPLGGGDIMYTTDIDLVKNSLGNLLAYKKSTTTATKYWLASRNYAYSSSTHYRWYIRFVNTDGVVGDTTAYYFYNNNWYSDPYSYAIRPIVTIKSGVKLAGGNGTSKSPWLLQ